MWTTTLLLTTLLSLPSAAPRGDYVEARTAAVYAGACHFGSQYTTQGRGAVLAWHIEAGAHAGVALAGVELVVGVCADRNLAEPDAARRSVVWLDPSLGADVRAAALAWLRAEHAGVLGTIVGVEAADVRVVRAGEDFEVRAGTAVRLAGSLLPERECCTMPYDVWYEPFVRLGRRIVGCAREFRLDAPALGRRWSRPGENGVFVGRFGAAP